MTCNTSSDFAYSSRDQQTKWPSLRSFLQLMRQASAIHRQRQALRGLTPEQLADIGVTKYEAEREATRDFWDLPHRCK